MFNFKKQRLYIISTIPSKVDPKISILKCKMGLKCTFDLNNPSFVPKEGVPYAVFIADPGTIVRVAAEAVDYDSYEGTDAFDYASILGYSPFEKLMDSTENYVEGNRITVDELLEWISVMRNLVTKDTEVPVSFLGYVYYFDNTFKFVEV